MSLTWSLTNPTNTSTDACVFDGTPEVAFRVTSQRNPSVGKPSASVVSSVSQCSVQKPPPSLTGLARNVRWCWMYSVGLSSVPSAIALLSGFPVTHEKRHAEHDHGRHERRDHRHRNDVGIRRQREPQSGHDHDHLARFRPE